MVLYAGSLFGKIDIAAAVAASVCVAVALAEYGYRRAVSVYAVIAVLSCLLLPSKTAATLFTAFFGYYPVLKTYFEYRFGKMKSYVVKYSVMNTVLAVLTASAFLFTKIHVIVIAGVFIGANAILPFYDIAFASVMNWCYEKLRKR